MKKNLALSLLLLSCALLTYRAASAYSYPGHGGIVAVMLTMIGVDDNQSKKESQAPVKNLKGEFAALNSSPENLKLVTLTAGGSDNLKALLK